MVGGLQGYRAFTLRKAGVALLESSQWFLKPVGYLHRRSKGLGAIPLLTYQLFVEHPLWATPSVGIGGLMKSVEVLPTGHSQSRL